VVLLGELLCFSFFPISFVYREWVVTSLNTSLDATPVTQFMFAICLVPMGATALLRASNVLAKFEKRAALPGLDVRTQRGQLGLFALSWVLCFITWMVFRLKGHSFCRNM
jgi:hypothetical protein